MEKILIFSGTSDGNRLARCLASENFDITLCVATEYGGKVAPHCSGVTVKSGRLDAGEMKRLITRYGFPAVVDATHPYAKEVSENILSACGETGAEYLRLGRGAFSCDGAGWVPSAAAAAEYLKGTEGNVLLTTGSKELKEFTAVPGYRERLFARVLSTAEVAEKCRELGFEGKNLICMQGPFSEELNYAMLRQIDAKWLVTKESGTRGGFPEKAEAARRAGAELIIIGRPMENAGQSADELFFRFTGKHMPKAVFLVGIGMGSTGSMTKDGEAAIKEADLVIGAERMLNAVKKLNTRTACAYKAGEIRDIVSKTDGEKIAVALSGDVGFFSGAKSVTEELRSLDNVEIKRIPGISSAVYLCAKAQTSWEDAVLLSLHGRQSNLVYTVRHNPKVFAIVGGGDAVKKELIRLCEYGLGHVHVTAGKNLSYDDEVIYEGTAEELSAMELSGLFSILILNDSAKEEIVTHGIPDAEFVRGSAPMTKEEVRSVSLSKLRLEENSVVYDVGAGTGSVSIEMARMAAGGTVYAVERDGEACGLIETNRKKFGTENIHVISGFAPDALRNLPAPTHVFIGGSGGNMKDIVEAVFAKNPSARVVINTIAMESTAEALEIVNTMPVKDVDITQLSVAKSRKVGRYNMMTGNNPVTITSFTGSGE